MTRSVWKDWVFWCFLSLAVATLACVVMIKFQLGHLWNRSQWSIEDRANIHESQRVIYEALKRLENRR
jgi:hypothetical protein